MLTFDMHFRSVRYSVILISVAELAFLATYFAIALCKVPWGQVASTDSKKYDDNFVSDLIFTNYAYKVLVTIFVVLQLLACALFVSVLNLGDKPSRCCGLMVFEFICLLTAFVSWFVLTSIYIDDKGGVRTEHIAGAGVFMSACGLYFGAMVVNLFSLGKVETRCEIITFTVTIVLFACSVVSGIVFMVSFYDNTVIYGWVYEHSSFVLLVAAHLFLFVTDTLISIAHESMTLDLPFRAVRVDYASLVLRGRGEYSL